MNDMQSLIKDIADEKNIKFNLISKDWIIILEKDNKIRSIAGYKFDLNNHASGLICDDKYALYDLLKLLNVPVVEHHILFKNYNKKEVEAYFLKHRNIVIKTNTGTCGNDMYHVNNIDDLFLYIDKLLKNNYSISISPYYDIKNEYRSIILNNNVEIFYGKKKPVVVGNGKSTIYELLCDFNNIYFKDKYDDALSRVLKDGEIFEYNWQHNLSKGAIPFEVTDNNLKDKVQSLALDTFKNLNLKFASVDIIELNTGELLVLEVNSGVMMNGYSKLYNDGYSITKNLYSKVIDEMFK